MSEKALGFFRNIDCVPWYRGMSALQTEACDGLLHALRDDMEQESTYRVRRCVHQLGLHPLVNTSQIKVLMAMSQGNDLAFLWFLWELAYKSPPKCRKDGGDSDSEYFTVNEQLLLSGIAHLDMPSTLRALDALLPPATQPKKRNSQKIKATQKLSSRLASKDHVLPYFAPQVRPREFIPKSNLPNPKNKLRFPEYSQYKDFMYQIPNERSRWFAQYQFCPAKRIVTRLLSEHLDGLGLEHKSEDSDPLCETHRFWKKEVITQQEEKVNSTLQHCLSQLSMSKNELKGRTKRILQDIEKNVQCLRPRPLGQVKSFQNERTSPTQKTSKKKKDISLLIDLAEDEHKMHLSRISPQEKLVQVMMMQRNQYQRCGAGDCEFLEVKCGLEEQSDISTGHKRKRSRGSHNQNRKSRKSEKSIVEEDTHLPTTNVESLADRIPACSRTLRCLKKKRCPEEEMFTTRTLDGFQLDYHKIYDLPAIPEELMPWEDDAVDVEDKQPVIEKLCIDALRAGEYRSVKELQRDKTLPPVLRAAANCAVDMFRINMEGKCENPPVKEQDMNCLIDPNNKQQIEDLLKEALQVLRRNPRFVLATLSNAHKMPVLLDWVAHRYGKTFSRDEMKALVKSSYRIYERVYQDEKHHRSEILRLKKTFSGFGIGSNYGSYNKFMRQVRQRKSEYHDRLNNLALEQSRLTWLALRGYSHLDGHIRDTFFAYMPSKYEDLRRQHVWKSDDYRNMVKLRLRTHFST
ncbi:uncharacterized protein LOC108033780 [Drosophila biarmipes]|uniref:uncharacterized protein LOC108033780 n=1 Tax=Drosophila biarmipes TaxID=125945 RepID=UPI0007E5DEC2|nr:uncharacterized protein LOC108033780 [Drosophila biarmipes]